MRGVSARPLGSALTSLALALALAVGVPAPSALAESTTTPTPAVVLQKAAAPRLVSASATKLALDWADVSGAQGYRVRYSRFSSMKSATSLLVTDSAATISGLKRSTRYYLRIQAVLTDAANTAVSSASSTVSFKTAALGAPTGLRAKASVRNANTVALNWSFSTPGRHYLVQYAPSPDFVNATNSAARVASAAIGGLVTGQLYYFRVRIVNAAGSPTSGWSSAVAATPQTPADPEARSLEVATLNIRNWKRSKGGSWKLRGPLVAETIMSRNLDVVGLQEADFNTIGGISQFDSLIRLLKARGGDYRVVSGVGTTAGTRILYNAATVSLHRAGMRRLSTLAKDVKRYVVWGEFVQNSTERRFFFANTHLIPEPKPVATKKCSAAQSRRYKMRRTQAGQVMAEIRANNVGNAPVVLVGDMNSHKVQCPTNAPYRVFTGAGLVDPLGNPDRSRVPINPTTEVRIHSEWDTSNHYSRKPVRHNIINGHHVDYVFVSTTVPTLTYEIVVNISDSTHKYVGRHASDHNMVRATVLIPAS